MGGKDTRLLFVGGVFPKEMEETIIQNSKANIQLAANNFQWKLIKAFDEYLDKPVTVFNEMFIGSFPKNYKKITIPSFTFTHIKGAADFNLGFLNLAYLKQVIPPFSEKRRLKEWIRSTSGDKAIFIYSLEPRFIRITKYIKKIDPNIPVIVSVMDLPEHIMKSREKSCFVKIWKKHLVRQVYSGLTYVDGCMLVANGQLDKLPKKKSDCVTIEAIVSTENESFIPLLEDGKKRIVYAGTLSRQYNILDLVDAFKKITDQNVELLICGTGETKERILSEAEKDTRIKYLGVLTKIEVENLMKKAWILVNPRDNGQDFTAYSFPSKTMDYLLAGRPIVCQKLEAIPPEYDKHLIYFDKNDRRLETILDEVLSYDIERINSIGKSNYNFITTEKSGDRQIQKIIALYDKKRNKTKGVLRRE